jgi:hypothetical protein
MSEKRYTETVDCWISCHVEHMLGMPQCSDRDELEKSLFR